MPLNLFLEPFWEPSSLTFSFLVAPVAKTDDIFEGALQARKMTRLASVGVGRGKRSAGEAAPPIFDLKNNTLVHLYLECLLLLRYGGFYWQPGGLVPRARGRIYVACGEHPAASGLYMFFCTPVLYPMRSCLVVLVVGTLQGLVVSL